MNSQQQIYKSVLKTAIQKAFRKNFPMILEDAIGYLEEHDWEVKERRKRSKKSPPVKKIEDLERRTDKKLSKTAEKMKTTPYLNLNTNRVHSDSKQIKKKHPDLDFGVLSQGQTRVWVCGTPGHLERIQTQLTINDEKTPAVFEPTSEMNSIPEEDEEEVENEEVENEEVENEEVENDSLSELSDAENLDEIYNALDLPEEEAPPVIGSSSPQRSDNPPQLPNSAPSVLVSNSPQIGPEAENPVSPLFLEGISPATQKKLKRRKRKKKKVIKNVEKEASEIGL